MIALQGDARRGKLRKLRVQGDHAHSQSDGGENERSLGGIRGEMLTTIAGRPLSATVGGFVCRDRFGYCHRASGGLYAGAVHQAVHLIRAQRGKGVKGHSWVKGMLTPN